MLRRALLVRSRRKRSPDRCAADECNEQSIATITGHGCDVCVDVYPYCPTHAEFPVWVAKPNGD